MITSATITNDKLRQAADFLVVASQLIRDAISEPVNDQAYFITEEWQHDEREVDELLKAGKSQVFNSIDEWEASLHQHV